MVEVVRDAIDVRAKGGEELRRGSPSGYNAAQESVTVTMYALASIAVVAAAATLGDFIWYVVGVRHTMTAGLVHGALLLTTVGAALGAASGQLVRGLPIGALAGIGGALSYYVLILVMDSRTYGTAIPGAWVIMWLLLAALDGRWLRAPKRRSWSAVATRGVVAAVAGGVAFALVRNILWGRPPEGGRNYLLQFATWAFAWAPGLLALTSKNARLRAKEAARSITPVELLARIDRGDRLHILDVRTEGEFASGHVPGAVNIPFNRVLSRLSDVPGSADAELFLYCGHGPRAYMAAAALRTLGRTRIVYLSGHFAEWRSAGLRVDR
jgi:phage shock protein E